MMQHQIVYNYLVVYIVVFIYKIFYVFNKFSEGYKTISKREFLKMKG
ncbi:Uncharacterised protein [Mycobacteroides abscessus subsp. massiliense]|nr:Uncharacterised protein [Mycobacteroides abscessus subsp. massiliense]